MKNQVSRSMWYAVMLLLLLYVPFLNAQTGVLKNNIYTPILVTSRGVAASGFYFSKGPNTYFVTARHVLMSGPSSLCCSLMTLTSYSPGGKGPQAATLELDLAGAQSRGEIHWHPTHDAAVIRISRDTLLNGRVGVLFLPHVSPKALPDSGIVSVSAVTPFESTILSNDAYILGYPGAIGVPSVPQLDYSQPLIRKGIVAGKNLQNRTLIVDCPTYPGNSGGPVFEVDEQDFGRTMRLIGLVSEFIPFEETWRNTRFGFENHQISNSGYCVVVPIDFVIDLAK